MAGVSVLDVGWFTYLMTNSMTIEILNPLEDVLAVSYLSTHISILYYPLSLIYQYISSYISPPLYFGIVMGLFYSIISLSIFLAGEEFIKDRDRLWLLALSALAVLAPFNGVGLGLIGFPHIEIAIPALILLFFTLYFRGYRYSSYFAFISLLLIREDAGFHLFSILSLVLILYFFITKSIKELPKDLIIILILSLLASISMILIQKSFFAGDNALERIYLGTPHFAHLSYDFIYDRLEYFIYNREYIYIPMLLMIPLSIWSKNPFLPLPLISTLPWFILSIIAINPMPHSFTNYYAFPFIIPSTWAIISFLIMRKALPKSRVPLYKIATITLLTIGLSISLFNGDKHYDSRPWSSFNLKYMTKLSQVDIAVRAIENNKKLFGNIMFDETMSSFHIKNLKRLEYCYLNTFVYWQEDIVNTLIFNKSSIKIFNILANKPKIRNIYIVKGTDIIIASEYNLSNSQFASTVELEEISYDRVYKKILLNDTLKK
jgi:hypothetical protein